MSRRQKLKAKAEMTGIGYRPEIDGLRAIAIIGVIVCHINPEWLPGGFLGVDIFFVLSGYLITSIILRDRADNHFSFMAFYAKRARRLLPALYLVLVATMLLGFAIYTPERLLALGRAAFASSAYISNYYLVKERGYFDPDAKMEPLVHTWSLAVEEQFYLLWPLALIVISSLKIDTGRTLKLVMVVGTVASFALAQWLTSGHHQTLERLAYYGLPTRAWQLMLGAAMTQVATPKIKQANANSIVGVLLIMLSFLMVDEKGKIPALGSLPVCIGTALIIKGTECKNAVQELLARKAIVFVGLISYSLYLWHWPILAFMRYVWGENALPITWLMIAVMLMVVLACLSWKYIEKPFRKLTWSPSVTLHSLLVLPLVLILAIAFFIHATEGATFRYENYQAIKEQSKFIDEKYCHDKIQPSCTFGAKGKPAKILLVGDSVAAQFSAFWDQIGNFNNIGIDIYTVSSCYPLLNSAGQKVSKDTSLYDREKCGQQIEHITKTFKKYSTVVLSGAWNNYAEGSRIPAGFDFKAGVRDTLQLLDENNIQTLVVISMPVMEGSVSSWNNLESIPFGAIKDTVRTVRGEIKTHPVESSNDYKWLYEISEGFENVKVIEMIDVFVAAGFTYPFANGRFIFIDQAHINQYASESLGKALVTKLNSGQAKDVMPILLEKQSASK